MAGAHAQQVQAMDLFAADVMQTGLALSQAAVREALSRLTAEGLVEIERHRGFRVAPVSADGIAN